eukprot:7162972-Alexandrium_andersonii.AAC.1
MPSARLDRTPRTLSAAPWPARTPSTSVSSPVSTPGRCWRPRPSPGRRRPLLRGSPLPLAASGPSSRSRQL